jgi:hypothetical protein
MPVPTHRENCKSRIWRTKCQFCGNLVWYFSCSCGSRVFFDSIGWPWPLHQDSCTFYRINTLLDEGLLPSQILKSLEFSPQFSHQVVTHEIRSYLQNLEQSKQCHIVSVLPGDERCEISGTVINITPINFYKHFDIPDNLIYRTILKDLIQEPFMEVTVREELVAGARVLHQWVFVVRQQEVNIPSFHPGIRAYATIKPKVINIDDEQAMWIAEYIDWD